MMKDIIIMISKETRMVDIHKSVIGVDNENLQSRLVFKFADEFVTGTARLEYVIGKEKHFLILDNEEEAYSCPIKNVLLKKGQINMQLVITEPENELGIPVFKSNVFYLIVNEAINAESEAPEGYKQWLDIANSKLAEIDESIRHAENLDIQAEKEGTIATIAITKKDGSQKYVEIFDGRKGEDATINGVNTLELIQGAGITLEQEGSQLTISSPEYDDTEIREQINAINEDLGTVQDEVQTVKNDIDDLEDSKANKSETYTQTEVNQLIGAIKTVSMKVVPEKPETGEENVIYLVPSKKAGKENTYDEYIYVNGKWELIGSTATDISGYVTTEELEDVEGVLNGRIDGVEETANNALDLAEEAISKSGGAPKIYVLGFIDGVYNNNKYNKQENKDMLKIVFENYKKGINELGNVYMASPNYSKSEQAEKCPFIPIRYDFGLTSVTFSYIEKYSTTQSSNGYYDQRAYSITATYSEDEEGNITVNAITYATTTLYAIANANNAPLMRNNTTSFSPTSDFQPATKKYVDDAVAGSGGGSEPKIVYLSISSWLDSYSLTQGDNLVQLEKAANDNPTEYIFNMKIDSKRYIPSTVEPVNANRFKIYYQLEPSQYSTFAGYNYYMIIGFDIYLYEEDGKKKVSQVNTTAYKRWGVMNLDGGVLPATEEYVNNKIAEAITQTLGGEY